MNRRGFSGHESRSGDEGVDALDGMLEQEIPRMRRYARALLHDHVDAEDLVHDTVVRALSRAHLWRDGTNLRAWLFTILHNQYVDEVRKSSRMGRPVSIDKVAVLGRPAPQLAAVELIELDRALGRLPRMQRTILMLSVLEGMNHEQVAKRYRIPVGTVRSRLSRARRRLRALLDDQAQAPGRRVSIAGGTATVARVELR
jgi:RNA polymerase sigma-70 factor (ECF subfamily)